MSIFRALKIKGVALLLAMVLAVACSRHIESTGELSLVPYPSSVERGEGEFALSSKTIVQLHFENEKMASALNFLDEVTEKIFGKSLVVAESADLSSENTINIYKNDSFHAEGYTMEVTRSGINIFAASASGVFYAFQTRRQLIPTEAFTTKYVDSVGVPVVKIEDAPHFSYRGVLLDVCRHFFTVDQVKQVIDIAAMHKMNKFHWHLTEDQGWRIEIKRFPLLTEVGSCRADSQVIGTHHCHDMAMEGVPYGPYFYTQEQIREVVAYAAERFVTVIPEIDMPGHMLAAMASYPHLGCVGEGYKVRETWGIAPEVLCIGKESTFEFVEGVLEEVLTLFPSEYIHIGGDEAPREAWAKCPECQKRMRREGLKSEAQLQSYFNRRIENFLSSRGRKMIGWDEILEGGVTPTSTIMSWRGTEGGIAAAKAGNSVIMTPHKYCYLSRIQSRDRANEPLYGVRHPDKPHHLSLDMAYNFNPYDGLSTEEQKNIIGMQACVWTEQIKEFDHLLYMYLPRLSAIAESAWGLPSKNFENYVERVAGLLKLYDVYGYDYALSYWRDLENSIE